MGVDIVANWQKFNFSVDMAKNSYQVQLSSSNAIKEPFINILVEVV